MSSPSEIVSAFIAAIEAKDVDRAMALVSDDLSYENVPMRPIVGKEATRTALQSFLGLANGIEWRIDREVATGNVVVNERLDRFEIGSGWLELPVAGFFEVSDDGLITLWRDYFDLGSYTRQLGELTSQG